MNPIFLLFFLITSVSISRKSYSNNILTYIVYSISSQGDNLTMYDLGLNNQHYKDTQFEFSGSMCFANSLNDFKAKCKTSTFWATNVSTSISKLISDCSSSAADRKQAAFIVSDNENLLLAVDSTNRPVFFTRNL